MTPIQLLLALWLVPVPFFYVVYLRHWKLKYEIIFPGRDPLRRKADDVALGGACLTYAVFWFALLDLYFNERRYIADGTLQERLDSALDR